MDFRSRLILAVIDAIQVGDPLLVIGVSGKDEIRLGWNDEVGQYIKKKVEEEETKGEA
jgi:hypothetical protein